MATVISEEEAFAHAADLLGRAMRGEEIVVEEHGKAKLRLIPLRGASPRAPKRVFGLSRGQYTVPDSFFDPMTEDELREWGY